MRRSHMFRAGFALLVSLMPLVPKAAAEPVELVRLHPGYARAISPDEGYINPDAPLVIVGKVDRFAPGFPEDAAEADVEFTYVLKNLISNGTSIGENFEQHRYGLWTTFSSGVFEILRDPSPDASFADAATFQDGTPVLTGAFSSFELLVESGPYEMDLGVQSGEFRFSGGTRFPEVSENGTGYLGTNSGSFEFRREELPEEILDLGYIGRSETLIVSLDAVPVEPVTWGRIKTLLAR